METTKYIPLNIPVVDLPEPVAPRAIDGKLTVLTPERLLKLYKRTVESGQPIVIWAADEAYVRELERWFRGNLDYVKESKAQRKYLLDVIEELRSQSGEEVSKE